MRITRPLYLILFAALLMIHGSAVAQSLEDLFRAVQNDDRGTVTELLDHGLGANATDREGNTVLMLAARLGYADMVKLLIARKADVNRRNPFGDTALMAACLKAHLGVVKLLVENGAEINRPGWTPLGYAAFGGNPSIVRYLLEKGADKDAIQPNGDTPLMIAVRNDNVSAARELLYANADFEHAGAQGETALEIAKKKGNPSMIKLLEQAGAAR